jgi:hypothetical protein
MWHASNARIYGVFIEYKRNPRPIRALVELLVQVEGKLLSFSSFALLSVLPHECA